MMSMLAKRLGAKKVITLITNSAYAELVGQEIDIAISPQQITISSLLTHVRKVISALCTRFAGCCRGAGNDRTW